MGDRNWEMVSHNPSGLISLLARDATKKHFTMFMEFGTVICGLLTLSAGVLGIYWGAAVVKLWPPLTWNNCVGGFFMIIFGIATTILGIAGLSSAGDAATGANQAEAIRREAKFLDVFAG